MLGHVRHQPRQRLLRDFRRQALELHRLILMHRHVRHVVLVKMRSDRLAYQQIAALAHWIRMRHVVGVRQDLVRVADVDRVEHAPVDLIGVVHFRRALGELQDRLSDRDALCAAENVGVADRNDANRILVEVLAHDHGALAGHCIRILIRQMLGVELKPEDEFLACALVQPLVDG